jgi:hypothetical protein
MPKEPKPEPLLIRPRKVLGGTRKWINLVDFSKNRGWQAVLGYLLATLAVILGLGVIAIYNLLNNNSQTGIIVKACLMGGLGLVGALIHSLFRHAKRYRTRHALQVLLKDPRPPLLLLRAFRDDFRELHGFWSEGGALTFNSPVTRTFEEFLYETFSRCGPVVAIGRPGETLPPLGASRLWVRDKDWRLVVDGLLKEAQYTIMIMGNLDHKVSSLEADAYRYFEALGGNGPEDQSVKSDDGLTWEVKRLFAVDDPQKIILIMPPVSESEAARRWNQYKELSRDRLPPYQGGEIAAAFEADGTCRVSRIDNRLVDKSDDKRTWTRSVNAYQTSLQIAQEKGDVACAKNAWGPRKRRISIKFHIIMGVLTALVVVACFLWGLASQSGR